MVTKVYTVSIKPETKSVCLSMCGLLLLPDIKWLRCFVKKTEFFLKRELLNSMGCVGSMDAWMAWVAYVRGVVMYAAT